MEGFNYGVKGLKHDTKCKHLCVKSCSNVKDCFKSHIVYVLSKCFALKIDTKLLAAFNLVCPSSEGIGKRMDSGGFWENCHAYNA
jgi:hypothetical protein